MTRFIIICVLAFFTNGLYSQVYVQVENTIKLGDKYYSKSYTGVKTFMDNISHSDEKLHKELLYSFDDLKDRRNQQIAFYTVAGLSSIVAMATAINNIDKKNPNTTVVGVAEAISIVSVIVAVFSGNRSQHYNDFVNNYNMLSKGNKMKLQLGLNSIENQAMGLSMTLKF